MEERKKIIVIALSTLLLLGAGAFLYSSWNSEREIQEWQASTEDETSFAGEEEEESEEVLEEEGEGSESTYLEVSRADCDNECQAFAGKAEELQYCRSFCGLSEEEGATRPVPDPASCEARQGVERDYCYKDAAVAEQDLAKCEEIKDMNIKKSCQARVTEDLLP